jgi:two-component system copper resistance phosphate regulon response regulator CusR
MNHMKIFFNGQEPSFKNYITTVLTENGYLVDEAHGDADAISIISTYPDAYDIAIFSVSSENSGCITFCKEIRKREILLPIMVIVPEDDSLDTAQFLDAGADDCFMRPFFKSELLAHLRALLRRPQHLVENTLTAGDINLDTLSRKAYKAGKEIVLSTKEFCILEYLMRNPNQVMLRNSIADHVWDSDFLSSSNVIDVHINNIRRKMQLARTGILETVRGVGYRIRNGEHSVLAGDSPLLVLD